MSENIFNKEMEIVEKWMNEIKGDLKSEVKQLLSECEDWVSWENKTQKIYMDILQSEVD